MTKSFFATGVRHVGSVARSVQKRLLEEMKQEPQ
jgi:hypothetical protein